MSLDNSAAVFPPIPFMPNENLMFAHGMSLRDYFAACALQMFDAPTLKAGFEHATATGVTTGALVAAFAYDIADAMLAERSKL